MSNFIKIGAGGFAVKTYRHSNFRIYDIRYEYCKMVPTTSDKGIISEWVWNGPARPLTW